MKLKYLKIIDIIQLLCDFAAFPSIPGHCNERQADQNNLDTTEVFSQSLGLLQVSCCQVSPFMSCPFTSLNLSFIIPEPTLTGWRKLKELKLITRNALELNPKQSLKPAGPWSSLTSPSSPSPSPTSTPPQAMVTNNTTFLTIATTILAIFHLSHL